MSATRVAVLTPPGSGAIAVLSIRGPGAWAVLRSQFITARGGRLPDSAPGLGLWFGRFGDAAGDEVIVAAHDPEHFELHCHGGRRVVAWLLDLLRSNGSEEATSADELDGQFANPLAAAILPFARTVRTAAILLDQAHGAFDRAVKLVETGGLEVEALSMVLRRNAAVGRYLVDPWTIAIAGAPNAGKSTLVNALAGFDRSIVSPIPGTTRDAVSVSVAFDGWPVELIDTAGLRESADALESEGVERARTAVGRSDLCVWLVDAAGPRPSSTGEVAERLGRDPRGVLIVFNKCDMADVPAEELPEAIRISAATGRGLTDLAAAIVMALVPVPPKPGEPVPFTPDFCVRWS
jgi:tRNA modification GTPase